MCPVVRPMHLSRSALELPKALHYSTVLHAAPTLHTPVSVDPTMHTLSAPHLCLQELAAGSRPLRVLSTPSLVVYLLTIQLIANRTQLDTQPDAGGSHCNMESPYQPDANEQGPAQPKHVFYTIPTTHRRLSAKSISMTKLGFVSRPH
jgi:hypothetical protein